VRHLQTVVSVRIQVEKILAVENEVGLRPTDDKDDVRKECTGTLQDLDFMGKEKGGTQKQTIDHGEKNLGRHRGRGGGKRRKKNEEPNPQKPLQAEVKNFMKIHRGGKAFEKEGLIWDLKRWPNSKKNVTSRRGGKSERGDGSGQKTSHPSQKQLKVGKGISQRRGPRKKATLSHQGVMKEKKDGKDST